MMLNSVSVPAMSPVPGSGGFMDPDRIAAYFGLSEGMKVADFGSGAGYFSIILAKMVGASGTVTAIDVMESALETLRAKAKANGLNNLTTIRANLEVAGSSGLADASQDMVLLANVLFQSDNRQAIITEAVRVLKPGGSMVVIDWRQGAGGFGPPEHIRLSADEMTKISSSLGMQMAGTIDAGAFHFGLKFVK